MSGRKLVGLDGVAPALSGPSRNLIGSRARPIKPTKQHLERSTTKEANVADNATIVDPRVIAESLQMDTYDLAAVLVGWARDAVPSPGFETTHARGPMPMDDYDEQVAKARRYLESAHAAFDAWQTDNPEDETTD